MASKPNPAKTVLELRRQHVETERDDMFRRNLHRILEVSGDGSPSSTPARFTGDQETRGIVVIEPSGGGKTTAIRRVLDDTEALGINPETGMRRYLQIQVPSPATVKSVGLAILAATGMPEMKEKTPAWEIWTAVRHRLGLLGISVLWLDEAQDVILAKSQREADDALRMLKSLMQGPDAVVLILSGTQQLDEFTSLDPQVARRFAKIKPRPLEIGADEEGLDAVIKYYCDLAELRRRLPGDLASRLIKASRQRFGRAVETIVNAIECALMDDSATVTIDHFVEAWGMQEGCDIDANVFDAPDWLDIPLDAEAREYEELRARSRRKKLERA